MFSESESIVGVEMKIPAVFLLAVLGCVLQAEGAILSKCQLKEQLSAKIMQKGLGGGNLLAKIVCHVAESSGFNTSAVNELIPGLEDHLHRRKREAAYGGIFSLAEEDDFITTRPRTRSPPPTRPPYTRTVKPTQGGIFSQSEEHDIAGTVRPPPRGRRHAEEPPHRKPTPNTLSPPSTRNVKPTNGGIFSQSEEDDADESTVNPHRRGRRHAEEPHHKPTPNTFRPPTNHRDEPTHAPRDDEEVWKLYGLFQLSNHLVCSDGTAPSPNICGISCSDLLDDDITDDINCVMKILSTILEKGFGAAHFKELRRMVRFIFQEVCKDVQDSEYFAECLP